MVASLARTVFGLLDLLLFLRHVLPSVEHALRYFRDPAPWPAFVLGIEAVRTLAVASLLASGLFLLRRRRRSAVAITVLQLPLRIAFGLFTFDVLLWLDRFLPPTLEAQYGLLLALILLEVVRAVLTPFIFRCQGTPGEGTRPTTRSRARPDPLAPRGEAVS